MKPRKTKVFVVANQKGGVAKTTTANAIGTGFANKRKKVLFIDLDSQCNLTFIFNGLSDTDTPTAADVMTGKAPAAAAIMHKGKVDLIPADPALAIMEKNLTGDKWQYTLADAIKPILNDYDYIIIDTKPALDKMLVCALTAATDVIIPTAADYFSIQGANQIFSTINGIQKINQDLHIAGLLVTQYQGRLNLTKDAIDLLNQTAKANGTKVFKTKIRRCIALAEAVAMQQDIITYAPKSTAAEDYSNLLTELR